MKLRIILFLSVFILVSCGDPQPLSYDSQIDNEIIHDSTLDFQNHDLGIDTASDSNIDLKIPDADAADAGPWKCPIFAAPILSGLVTAPPITEASGIVSSRKNKNVLWVHNDSPNSGQNEARVFAINTQGTLLGVFYLNGATNIDWEDIAIGKGPLPNEDYLYLGDIGGNVVARQEIIVYRVIEPVVSSTPLTFPVTLSNVEAISLTYPTGTPDAETLLVDPQNANIYVVTKDLFGFSKVYQSAPPYMPPMQDIATITLGLLQTATGGDISPSGEEILIRTYDHIFLWHRILGQPLFNAFSQTPCIYNFNLEPSLKGEAIGFAEDGKNFYTIAEGTNSTLFFFSRNEIW